MNNPTPEGIAYYLGAQRKGNEGKEQPVNGIRVTWTRRREEYMEAYLTFNQVRERFGLGGTIDKLVTKRMGKIATHAEIVAATEELTEPRMWNAAGYQILNLKFQETDKAPVPEVKVCCTCQQPLPAQDDEPPF